MSEIDEIASTVADELLALGFTVHRYDAFSTNSVYLKLDWGACGSIRISDHEGYGHLRYRWNIGTHIRSERHSGGRYPRGYYRAGQAARMVSHIASEREARLARTGPYSYADLIERGRHAQRTAKSGFWAHPSTREVASCDT